MQNTLLATKKILVAEDDSACRHFIELVLKDTGCSFVIVANGQEAVNKVRADKFDAILMDLRMPMMSGYAAMSAIREAARAVPVIAMTANVGSWEDGQCQDYGMIDHLSKPFEEKQLVEVLLKWTGRQIA